MVGAPTGRLWCLMMGLGRSVGSPVQNVGNSVPKRRSDTTISSLTLVFEPPIVVEGSPHYVVWNAHPMVVGRVVVLTVLNFPGTYSHKMVKKWSCGH